MKWIVACGLFLILAIAPALAFDARPIPKMSSADLKSACGAAGGDFVEHEENEAGIESPATYACHKNNCDGKGGVCTIGCGPAGCTATTPSAIAGSQTLVSILQNGNNVVRGPLGGGSSLSSPGTVGQPAPSRGSGPLL